VARHMMRPAWKQRMRGRVFGPSGFTGALDAYESDIAHLYDPARRWLTSYEGDLVRLRRDSDDAEADFGPDATGELDKAAIATWLGGSDGYIVTAYDQAGGDNVTQATKESQPLYVASAQNGHAGALFSSGKELVSSYDVVSQPLTMYGVTQMDLAAKKVEDRQGEMLALPRIYWYNETLGWALYAGTLRGSYTEDSDWNVWSAVFDAAASNLWRNGTKILGPTNAGSSGSNAVVWGDEYYSFPGYICCQILCSGAHDNTTRGAIQSILASYWGITLS